MSHPSGSFFWWWLAQSHHRHQWPVLYFSLKANLQCLQEVLACLQAPMAGAATEAHQQHCASFFDTQIGHLQIRLEWAEAQRQVTWGHRKAADGGTPPEIWESSPGLLSKCPKHQGCWSREFMAREPSQGSCDRKTLLLYLVAMQTLMAGVERLCPHTTWWAAWSRNIRGRRSSWCCYFRDLWTGTQVRSHPQSSKEGCVVFWHNVFLCYYEWELDDPELGNAAVWVWPVPSFHPRGPGSVLHCSRSGEGRLPVGGQV